MSLPNKTDSSKANHLTLLTDWQPEEDRALMWQLVCELANGEGVRLSSYELKKHVNVVFNAYVENIYKAALIAAYIAADPKGLIKKWREEQ